MKYLHICNDAHFIDFAIDQFERFNAGNNTFLICLAPGVSHVKHIRHLQNIIRIEQGAAELVRLVNDTDYDVLVIHFLDLYKCDLILRAPKDKKILWLAWGADIYQTGFYHKDLFLPATIKAIDTINRENDFIRQAKNIFRNSYYYLRGKTPAKVKFKNAIRRVDFCATVIPDEIQILNKWNFFNAKQVPFSYTSVEYDFRESDIENSYRRGNAIIIGNSNSPTSNHIDCLHAIQQFDLGERKIYVPLNYGNFQTYTKTVIERGYGLFKNNFVPLQNYLPKKDYLEVLQNCSVAIMGHQRQQALGNIIILLWMGVKVFFSETNIMLSFFKRKGFNVYSLQKDLNVHSISQFLSEEEVNVNRRLLMENYSHERVLEKTRTLDKIIAQSDTNKTASGFKMRS